MRTIVTIIGLILLLMLQGCHSKRLYNTGSSSEGRSLIRASTMEYEKQRKVRWQKNMKRNYKGGKLRKFKR